MQKLIDNFMKNNKNDTFIRILRDERGVFGLSIEPYSKLDDIIEEECSIKNNNGSIFEEIEKMLKNNNLN